MKRIARLTLATVALLGCRDIHAPDLSSIYRLEITPPNRAIALKEQYTLHVSAYNYSGTPLDVPHLVWSSSDQSVASVDANGVVTGLALGYSEIKAVGGGKTAYMTVHIAPAGLRISMSPEVLAVGDTGIITVDRVDYYGEVIDSEASRPWWEWEDNNIVEFPRLPGFAENQLAVIGKAPGTLFLWAESAGAAGGFRITVVPAGATR
jgi:hypothetical protein